MMHYDYNWRFFLAMISIATTPSSAQTFGSSLASLFNRGNMNQQQQSPSGNPVTGLRLSSGGVSGLQPMATFGSQVQMQPLTGGTMGTLGTRINMNQQQQQQSGRQQSGSIFSGLSDLFPGLGGGGGGGGGGGLGGLPGLPPGMTMTQDGCLCPMPKAKTKYIAVEVPKVVFVPPKEKTKIITIKEIVEKPASRSKYGDSEDDGVSFDEQSY